jgi:hypothetical protein
LPPRHPTGPARASFLLGVTALAALAASAGAAIVVPDYELRPALTSGAKKKILRDAEPRFGSLPGAGAGKTGFVSSGAPASAVKAEQSEVSERPGRGAKRLAERAQEMIARDDATGSVPRQAGRGEEETEPYAAVGLRGGSFGVKPSIEIFGGYDDNPFRTSKSPGSSFTRIEAKVETQSNWSRHELAGELRGAYTDFLQVDGNDRPEAEARLRGRIDVTSQGRIELEGRAALTTEDAGSPDAPTSARRPPHVYTAVGKAGFVQRFNHVEIGLRGSIERITYQDAELIGGGRADLSDRDLAIYGLTLRGSHEMMPGIKPFLEAGIDRRVFDRRIDFGGVRRGSDGMRGRIGVELAREGWLTGEASVGYTTRRYDDPLLDDAAGLIFDASLIWRATGLTTVTLKANSEIGETTLPGAAGVFEREASITIDHAFRRWLIGSASVTYAIDDFRGAGRIDRQLMLTAGFTYHLSRYAALKGEFRRQNMRSNIPGENYTANIVMLGLRLQR